MRNILNDIFKTKKYPLIRGYFLVLKLIGFLYGFLRCGTFAQRR